jgi:EmrB/QacA subfamily drug resistance transporter
MSSDRKYRLRWWTLIVLSVSVMAAGLQNTVTNVALPTLQAEFDASSTELQWYVNSYILVYAGFLLVMGAVGDKYGRATWLNIGLLIFLGGSVAAAFVPDGSSFIITQVVMGFGAAILTPATLAIIIDVFPKDERARAIGAWTALASLGIGIGPLVGGALLEVFWYGSVFIINLPVVLGAIAAGYFLVPNSRDESAPPIDVLGGVLSFLAITAIVYGLVAGPVHGWLEPSVLATFTSGAVLIIIFVRHEQSSQSPMVSMRLFKNHTFTGSVVAISATMFAAFAAIFIMTQFLQTVQQKSALEAGLIMTPLAFILAAASAVAPRLVESFGTRLVVVGGLVVLAVGVALQALWSVDAGAIVVILTTMVIALGAGIVLAPATAGIMRAVPEAQSGVGSGLSTVTRQVGGAIGIALLGSAQDSTYNDRVREEIPTNTPDRLADAATASVAGAHQLAEELGGDAGAALIRIANDAFVDGARIASLAGAAVVLLLTAFIFRLMPSKH